MGKVVILGAAGAVGSVATRTLIEHGGFDGVVAADIDLQRLEGLASGWPGTVRTAHVDGGDPGSVRAVVDGADVVLNCIGPFYRSVKSVLGAVLELGIDYVDICDDVDVTLEILDWDERARQAGVTALVGMGASPGVTNLFARYVADQLLDTCTTIDIFHTHGGEPLEGPGVIAHRFHCMSIDIPMFLDGRLTHVRYFEPDGVALRQTFDFPLVGDDVPIYPYPHPEQVTLPRHLAVERVTNKGSVLPLPYYELTAELCRLGLADKEPLDVGGTKVSPHDFATAFVIRERERILAEEDFGEQRGCISVVVTGTKDGTDLEYRMHMASVGQALGAGTGVPAALGAMLLHRGRVRGPGVLPPEAAVDPVEFLALVADLPSLTEQASTFVEEVRPDGSVTRLPL